MAPEGIYHMYKFDTTSIFIELDMFINFHIIHNDISFLLTVGDVYERNTNSFHNLACSLCEQD